MLLKRYELAWRVANVLFEMRVCFKSLQPTSSQVLNQVCTLSTSETKTYESEIEEEYHTNCVKLRQYKQENLCPFPPFRIYIVCIISVIYQLNTQQKKCKCQILYHVTILHGALKICSERPWPNHNFVRLFNIDK